MSLLFIFLFINIYDIQQAFELSRAIYEGFSIYPVKGESYFPGFTTKREMADFLRSVYIEQIFNERGKEFENKENKYHFLNGFNYFVGARITHNRASMETETLDDGENKFQKKVRKENYKGSTDRRYHNIDTGTFGRNNQEYSSNGGYAGKGGFVKYFKSDLDFHAVNTGMREMMEDGLIDDQFISLTLESIFYNENFKVGFYLVFEFMNNNAGKLQVFESTQMYQVSKYQLDEDQEFPVIRFILETIYFLLVIWGIYEIIRKMIKIFLHWKITKQIEISLHNILDLAIVILSVIWSIFWTKYNLLKELPTFPLNSEAEFTHLVEMISHDFTITIWLSALLIVFICIRNLLLLTTQFPSFGALFETIKIAKIDLINILMSITIM